MGLFDWFKSAPSNVTILEDVVWMTNPARHNGITRALSQTIADPGGIAAVIAVAHFQDMLDQLQMIVAQLNDPEFISVCAADLLERRASDWRRLGESDSINILVGERHPLQAHDDTVLNFARGLPCRSRIVHHLSLADPMMRTFNGKWVESILKRLGMAEDEAIESKLIARQIKTAQMKIASQAVGDSPADSAESWLEHNCPGVWNNLER